ncbi:MAG: hypothetical protein A2381_14335 [Bdellovibrionales bacterium RIFOXYB1_FULL_37_110]|nr:MAG: hypothetical protein A2417_07105 [Bdellovibrionales bacterium RIFOXYC1_FULL_37_79]OFZ57520.1 MAG: hypothetical protein A2381_14335 [Bdellovibrionales bacterium RIFOXYB1_FULL_37_110]OFZ62991.1 MAG: hypothetical protein A2577_07615 [Bdellovibrionales bacterium RIFOXYD1_FULL_36_51]
MKNLLFVLIILSSVSAHALDCQASKDGENATPLNFHMEHYGSITIDSYQHDVVIIGNSIVMNIFDRRTPTSSARALSSFPEKGQAISVSLETNDGLYSIKCK